MINKKILVKIILIILGIIPLFGIASGQYTLTIFSIFVLIWLIRKRLKSIVEKIPLPLFLKFIFLGIISGIITEYLVFLDSGVGIYGESGLFSQNLLFNLILAMGLYVSLILVWYFLLKKYKFNLMGIFFSAGIWGVVIEQDFAVLLSFDILAYIYIFAVYGSLVSIPFLLAGDGFDKIPRKENRIKYIVAFFTQFIAYIVGALWIVLLRAFGT